MFDLPPAVKLALEAAIPGLEAKDFLREHGHQVGADTLRTAVLRATGDEAQAEAAWLERAEQDVRAASEND